MSNQNIFTKLRLPHGLLSILLMLTVLTCDLYAEPPKGNKTEKPVPTEKAKKEAGLKQAAEAKAILLKSKNMLLELRSLKAKIKETIVVGNRRFRASGEYIQGSERKLKLNLEVKLGDTEDPLKGSLLQVCDGQILWSRYNVSGKIRLTRRDVGQILKAVEESDAIPQNILVAELGLGGIPTLLAAIEKNVAFKKSGMQTIENREYHVIEGEWSEEFRKKFHPSGMPVVKLPTHVPDKIRIYFDQKTLFPRRILYLKKNYKKETFLPMVMLDFVEVVLNSPVDDSQFNFIPADNESPVDITSSYLSKLKSSKKPKK
jgi:hypothetical protein